MREYTPDARPYELMTIFTPEVGDDTVLEELETVTEYIRQAGGVVFQVLHDAPWGRRRFAYPIRYAGRDVRDGIYSVIQFNLPPGQVAEVERELKLDEHVLRFLLTINEKPAKATTDEGEPAEEPAAIGTGDLRRAAEANRAAAEAANAERAAGNASETAPPPPAQASAPSEQPAPAAVPTEPDAVVDTVEPTDQQNESAEAATARPVTSESGSRLETIRAAEANETRETPAEADETADREDPEG